MKKIAMVAAPVHPVPPHKGAAVEWWMYQVCGRLTNVEPHIVCIATENLPDTESQDGIVFHRIHIGRLYRRIFQKILGVDPYSYVKRVARRVDTSLADIVHVHNAPALFQDLARHRTGPARMILHMHNAMPVEPMPPGTVMLVVSRYLFEWYRTKLPDCDIRIVTNGVDTEVFRPLPAQESAERRARWNVPRDKKIILYIGRVSPEKGPIDLVRAFRQLLKIRNDVFLLIVGEVRTGGGASDNRARYGKRVMDACAEIPNDCRIVGSVDPADIHDIYSLGNLVVVPSRFEEPFGMVAIEAMAAGVPVLAANRGGLREFVIPGETGFLIDNTEDAPAFARQMHEILEQPMELAQLRQNARSYVEKHHSWNIVARQLEQVYHSLLSAA